AMGRQPLPPPLMKFPVIDRLIAFSGAAGYVGTRGNPLIVDDLRLRLKKNATPRPSDTKTKICILIISWREMLIKASQFREKIFGNHEGGRRHVVDIAQEAKAGLAGIGTASPVPCVAHAPNYSPGLLQLAVRKEKFAADDAGIGDLIERSC